MSTQCGKPSKNLGLGFRLLTHSLSKSSCRLESDVKCFLFFPLFYRDAWDMAAETCLAQLPMLLSDPNAEFQVKSQSTTSSQL
jgi:hypothetical protein